MLRRSRGCFATMMTGVIAGLLMSTSALCAAELTFDLSDYRYREEDDFGNFQMHDEAKPVFASLGIRDWDRPETQGGFKFNYTGEVTAGRTHYQGRNAGVQRKKYYKARMEGLLSYRVNDLVSPFVGLGFRFVHDDSGGHPSANGGIAYDRQNYLLYLPFGFQIDPVENLSIKAQGNAVLRGWQISYLKDTNPNYQTAHNDQDKGWGFDVTANYKVTESWSMYSFYRYWSIDRSDRDCGTVATVGYVCWWEPDNTTKELGVGIAYRF